MKKSYISSTKNIGTLHQTSINLTSRRRNWRPLFITLYIVLWIISTVQVFRGLLGGQQFIILIIIGYLGYKFTKNKVDGAVSKEFADSIKYSYKESSKMDSVAGQLFSEGENKRIYDCISGNNGKIPLRIYSYAYSLGSGKNLQTHTFSVFEAIFNAKMPHIVVLSKESETMQHQDSQLVSGKKEELLLETNFNKYFSILSPDGNELEVYQLFTPDIMADFIDRLTGLNVEFYNNKIYLYTPNLITNKESFKNFFDLGLYLSQRLAKNIRGVRVPDTSDNN